MKLDGGFLGVYFLRVSLSDIKLLSEVLSDLPDQMCRIHAHVYTIAACLFKTMCWEVQVGVT